MTNEQVWDLGRRMSRTLKRFKTSEGWDWQDPLGKCVASMIPREDAAGFQFHAQWYGYTKLEGPEERAVLSAEMLLLREGYVTIGEHKENTP